MEQTGNPRRMFDPASSVSADDDRAATGATAPPIEIALATHNSAPFLGELLDSLFRQTCQDFRILVCDDGSSDATHEIISEYQQLFPERIRLVACGERPGGPLASFSRLMDHLTADYVLLCDHDDVWLPNKVALSIAHMRSLEAEHGCSTPILVHTDLVVVDRDLQMLSPSFFRYQKLNPAWNSLQAMLMSNTVTGCATAINRALYERARPVPNEAALHDHWLALVAASIGKIRCVEEGTILYRQHGRNAIGAIPWGVASILDRVRETLFEDTKQRMLERFSLQASALLARCGADMTPAQYRATAALADLWSLDRWRRFLSLWRHGFVVNGIVRNGALFFAVTRPRARDIGRKPPSPRASGGGAPSGRRDRALNRGREDRQA